MGKLKGVGLLLCAAIITMSSAAPAGAQAVTGSQVSGVVRDSSGAALPGVDVTITKTDTGLTRTAVTSEDGSYVLPNLPVGP